jgi:hypothetical protein
MTKALAYCSMILITRVERFIVEAPELVENQF